jgi:Inner membrane protein YgaP-like, transmembrane domain
MFKQNVGLIDRLIRAILGLSVLSGHFIWPGLTYGWAFWLGLVPVATALGWCPIYALFGVSSDRRARLVG